MKIKKTLMKFFLAKLHFFFFLSFFYCNQFLETFIFSEKVLYPLKMKPCIDLQNIHIPLSFWKIEGEKKNGLHASVTSFTNHFNQIESGSYIHIACWFFCFCFFMLLLYNQRSSDDEARRFIFSALYRSKKGNKR